MMRARVVVPALFGVLLVVLLARAAQAAGVSTGDSSGGRSGAYLSPVVIEIRESGFAPGSLAVPPHSTVTWVNRDTGTHTVTSDSGFRLDSPQLARLGTYSYTFHEAGTFNYHDELDPSLRGTVLVDAVPPATATPAAPPATPLPSLDPAPTQTRDPATPAATPSSSIPAGAVAPDAAPLDPTGSARSPSAAALDHMPGTAGAAAPLAGSATVDAGNEWFGASSFEGGVYEVTIDTGGTVQWTVVGGIHTVYECGENWSGATTCGSPLWHSSILEQGGTFSQTFDAPGTFYYLCSLHPLTMRGKVIVQGGSGTGGGTATPRGNAAQDNAQTPVPGNSGQEASSQSGALPNGGYGSSAGGSGFGGLFWVWAAGLAAAGSALAAGGVITQRRWKYVSSRRGTDTALKGDEGDANIDNHA